LQGIKQNVLDRVKATIAVHRMFPTGIRAGVAVSGGADSICLLHILHELAPELGITLHVLHLNHKLRGAESDADAEFVRAAADRLQLPCTIETADVAAEGGNLEQAGREARRKFYARLRLAGTVDRVATGHTRSDQAETVLYRLFRGSGTAGLSGIRPVTSEGAVRPLLDCSRADVVEYLSARHLEWREDRTNLDPVFVRNRIRHRLLPLIAEEFSPAISEILAATAVAARDEEQYWSVEMDRLAASYFRKKLETVLIRADEISRLHPAVARRLMRRAIAEVKGDMRNIDLMHVERILELAAQPDGHGRTQIPGLDIFRSFEWLRIGPQRTRPRSAGYYSFPVSLAPGMSQEYSLPGTDSSILLERCDVSPGGLRNAYNVSVDELDWERLSGPLELRNWYPGDELHLPGRSRQKIKFLFQESRVPIWDRQAWPVLTSGSEIVWARSFGASFEYRPSEKTRYLLRVHSNEGSGSNPSRPLGDQHTESREPNECV
jgi:tRNA(Ile)-lysidine synthase